MADVYGPLIGDQTVERAVVDLLSSPPAAGGGAPLLVYYLAEVERQAGLTQQTLDPPVAYRGGIDLETWRGDESPTVIVAVSPAGAPDRLDPSVYAQWFDIRAAAVIRGEDEDDARQRSRYYGLALTAAILQNGKLMANPYDSTVNLATRTELTAFPRTEFAADASTSRQILRSVVTFRTLVAPVVTAWDGPTVFPASPYTPAGMWPTVQQTNVTVTAR